VREKWIKTEVLFSKTDKSMFLFGCKTIITIQNQ